MITFESEDVRSSYIYTSSVPLQNVGQVRIQRPSGENHGHTSRKMSAVILPPVRFTERMNTTAQMASTLHYPGAACKHDNGKFHVSYLSVLLTIWTHSWVVDLRFEGSL